MEHSEQSEKDLLETSSDAVLSDNIQMGTKQKREDVTLKNKGMVTEYKEVNEVNVNETTLQKKPNINYPEQEIHDPAIIKKGALSSA